MGEVACGLLALAFSHRQAREGRFDVLMALTILVPGYVWVVAGLRAEGPLGLLMLVGVPLLVAQQVRLARWRRNPERAPAFQRRLIEETPSWGERLRHPIVASRRDSDVLISKYRR